ncbi:MAG: hypothetical protein HQM04_06065 [Magnetococcales bacterium]|nr:hypothetical protein [Magnetococcales bacterium]MBF0114592.1 hypothetical protein [Magnetococcales bacterium]
MGTESDLPLYVRPEEHDPENPFTDDQFDRRKLADRLTNMIGRLSVGCVLAIDAPWGEGKTWFGMNWASSLRSENFTVVFIDAFKQDYVEDPFLMLCSEILAEVKGDEQDKHTLVEAGVKVAKMLLPVAAKSAIRVAGNLLLGSIDLEQEIEKGIDEFDKGVADHVEKQLIKRLANHADDRKSVDGFKKLLQEYAQKTDKPLVIIIDELDRCRPDFAVRTIERIKHFFDVPGVVFILLVNRSQLEASIRGIYGADVDATTYLGKFVQFWLRLPKRISIGNPLEDHNLKYLQHLALRFGYESRLTEGQQFLPIFGNFASLEGLSLRDLERGVMLYALTQSTDGSGPFLQWMIYLKLALPKIYAGILAGDIQAHEDACKELARMNGRDMGGNRTLIIINDLHEFIIGRSSQPSKALVEYINKYYPFSVRTRDDASRGLNSLCRRIDL